MVTGATLVTLGTQAWHVVRDRNRWPLCTFNLFNYHLSDEYPQARVRLVTVEGSVVGPADPWGLLPLDFFRVVSIIERVFFTNEDVSVRERWCAAVLRGLNDAPWPSWDEVRGSLRPPAGERFAALELYLVQVDFVRCDPGDRSAVLRAELLHRHDPAGVAAGLAPPDWHLVEAGAAS